MNFIYFFGLKHYKYPFLSNFYTCSIDTQFGKLSSSEQYYMLNKAHFFGDNDTIEKMLQENNPVQIKKLGRLVKNFDQNKWDKVKEQIMYTCLCDKFTQNKDLKEKLKNCGPHPYFVEASPYDRIWGIGIDEQKAKITHPSLWPGQNLLGKNLVALYYHL